MTHMSDTDVKTHFVKVFGPKLGAKYHALRYQVILAHMNWVMLIELTKSQERRSLLESTGRYFFVQAHSVFMNEVILGLSRLTDKAQQGAHDNLSLMALLADICDPCLKSRIKKLIEKAEAKIEPLKIHRDKRIAHFDLNVAIDPNVTLPPIDDASVEEALAAVGKVLEQLRDEYTGHSTIQKWVPVDAVPDIEHLLFYLEAGLSEGKSYAKKRLERRQKRGQFAQD